MSDNNRQLQLGVAINADGVAAGAQEVKAIVKDMATSVVKDTENAGKSLASMGAGGNANIDRMAAAFSGVTDSVKEMVKESDRGLKAFVNQIQNTAAGAESVTSAIADKFEARAILKGFDPAIVKPYIDGLRQLAAENDQLRLASEKQADATRKSNAAAAEAAAKFNSFERAVQTAKIELLSFGKTASEKFQIRAEVLGLDKNSATQAILADLKAAEAKFQETADTINRKATPAMKGLVEGSRAYNAAMRQVPAQITDIVVSLQGGQAPLTVLLQQGGQLKDMFGGVGNAARAMGAYVAGLVNPFTIAVGAAAGLAFAYSEGAKESEAYVKALIMTGNAAGTTAGQLQMSALAVSKATGATQGAAADAMVAFSQSTGIATSNFEKFAAVAVSVQRETGVAVSETVKQFSELGKDPLKASLKLNETNHFLTLSVYEQIKALEEQGNAAGAAQVAQNAWASASSQRMKELEENLGVVTKAWRALGNAAAWAWNRIVNAGRTDTPEEMLAAKRTQLENLYKTLELVKNGTSVDDIAQTNNLKKNIALLQEQLAPQEEITRLKSMAATHSASELALAVEKANWDAKGVEFLDNKEKRQRALNEAQGQAQHLLATGVITQIEYEKRLANIRDKFKDPAKPKDNTFSNLIADISKFEDAAQQYLDTNTALTESDKFRIDKLSAIAKEWEHGKLTLDEVVEAELRMYNAQQKRVQVETVLRDLEQQKADLADNAKNFDNVEKATDALLKQVDAERAHVAAIGEAKDGVAKLEVAKLMEMATSKDRLAVVADEIDWSGQLGDQYRAQAKALRELAKLKTEGAFKEIAVEDAKKAAEEWKRTADKIESSITDALMRGFESGKGFIENLRDTIVNTFKTLVLRPIVQAVVNPVAQTLAGVALGVGAPSAASAADGLTGLSNAYTAKDLLTTGKAWMTDFGGQFAQSVNTLGQKLYDVGFEKIGGGLLDATNQAGAFSKIADYANAAGDALGYLNAAVQLSQGKVGAAVGAGIGTWLGGPIGSMIGSSIGGWIDNAFGGGHEYTTGTGIKGTFSSAGFKGNNYQNWRNDGSSGIFGIGASGSSSGTNLSALDYSTASALAQSFNQLQASTSIMVASLGLDAKKITEFSKDIQVALGADAAANKKALDAMFSSILDDMALSVAPDIADLSKASETAGQTLTRLSSSIITTNAWLSMFRQRLFQVSLAGADAASKLADAFGGLDKLTEAAKAFYDSYFTDAEKVANAQDAMTTSLAALGLTLPTTKAQFRALVDSLDLTTEGGRQAYATLLKLAPEFAQTADMIDKVATDTAKALLATFTGNGKLVDVLDATQLSLAGVQKGADVVVGAMTQVHQSMLDVNSPVLTFSGTVASISTDLTGAQKSALLLQDQIEALSGATAKAVIDFEGLTGALSQVDTTTFVATIVAVFENLSTRITDTINAIGTERVAVRNAAINIIDPTAMSKESIQAGISGINTKLPSTAALTAANDKLYAAISKTTTANATLAAAGAEITSAATAKTDLVAYYAKKLGELQALGAQYSLSGTRITFDSAAMGDNAAYQYNASTNKMNPYSFMGLFGYTDTYRLSGASTSYMPNVSGLKADPRYYPLLDLLDAGNTKLAEAAQRIADSQTALAAAKTAAATATTEQAAAEAAARQATLDYQSALQAFAIDASKSVTKLTNLRQETVKYYEAQKALANLMQTSASNLLATVANYRFSQLSPEAQAASLKGQFGTAYDMALASQGDGATLSSYADKLNSTLGPLIDALNATGQSNLISGFLAQAEAIAKLLQDNAPKNYQQDSLDMLGSIDDTLAALDASSQSAEKLITDAIKAGSDRTAAGLYAVIAAITGKTIPAFASGGSYAGGVALVGEQGPELINFNQPGQVYTASQTAGMFGGNGAVVEELKALRLQLENMSAETRATAIASNKTAKILERVTPDGVSLQTVAAV